MLTAMPPSMTPILAVVSWSMRPKLHLRDAFGGDFDRVDAFFRAYAGVGFETMDAKFHAIGRRRLGEQKAHRVAVEHQTRARAQAAHVETFGADQDRLPRRS